MSQSGNVTDKLILWKKGIISTTFKQNLLSNVFGKAVKDNRMLILGNSEIVVDNDIITTKLNSKNYYFGNLGEHKWKIKTITIY